MGISLQKVILSCTVKTLLIYTSTSATIIITMAKRKFPWLLTHMDGLKVHSLHLQGHVSLDSQHFKCPVHVVGEALILSGVGVTAFS